MAAKKSKCTVEFIGGNSEDVTGSCTKISTDGNDYLFEFGMIQGKHSVLDNYRANKALIEKVKPRDVKVVFIGHCHVDHIGLIPSLYSKNPNVRIIAPKGSFKILKEMWEDSSRIMQRDCEYMADKNHTNARPFYTAEEVELALAHVEEYACKVSVKIDDRISIYYVPAGHILNSCQMKMSIKVGTNVKNILFTSDLGNKTTEREHFYIEPFENVDKCNIVIGESTYSDSTRTITMKDYETDLRKIKSVITEFCINGNHRVLIPTFSLDRCPYILWTLYQLFGNNEAFTIPVVIDSPLTNRLLDRYYDILKGEKKEQFGKMLAWKNIVRIHDNKLSKSMMRSGKAKIVLSSSGMLTNGRSVKWAQTILPNSEDCILFCGYATENSLAGKIKNGANYKTISINGTAVKNKCQIVDLHSFSSHADYNQLMNYYKSINCEKIYLVHGNMNSRIKFCKELQDSIYKNCHTSQVIVANKQTKIQL